MPIQPRTRRAGVPASDGADFGTSRPDDAGVAGVSTLAAGGAATLADMGSPGDPGTTSTGGVGDEPAMNAASFWRSPGDPEPSQRMRPSRTACPFPTALATR